MRFRKSIKIAKGVRINIGKKGLSSLSLGGKGATVNVGSKGINATGSIPGTGLSETVNLTKRSKKPVPEYKNVQSHQIPKIPREVSFLLGVGIFIMPYIFSWFVLRQGYSARARIISFGWLAFVIFTLVNR